jgi:phage terminase large subunit-like protein
MERPYVEGDELLPSEWVKDGEVWDTRRLTSEIHLFQTRKSGKTEFGGAIDFIEVCFLGPANGQALICTNSAEQSQIAYKAIKDFAMQIDPTCINRLGGKYFRMTAKGMNWQPCHRMKGEIKCMAAGKTPKDGLYASVVHADEHGQATYINGRSDMQAAVETCWGSTGPRREKLLMHTTTAGNLNEGPYKSKLESVEESLLRELDIPLDFQSHRTEDDNWFAFILQLDKWEITDDLDKLDNPELFKKVNRSIGITVQPDYYRKRLHEASQSEDTKQEVLTKDFNMWQIEAAKNWLTAEDVRPLQRDMRIDQCADTEGWIVFAGLDFSKGDDLNGVSYLAYNTQTGEFFADMDSYMSEAAVNESPIRALLLKWAEEGWLHIVPGKTFDPSWPVNRIIELDSKGINFGAFGYDPYNAEIVMNSLRQWVFDIGLDPARIIQPVRQNFATYTPAVQELDYYVKRSVIDSNGKQVPDPIIHFSMNPLWPWEFGNVVLRESADGMENLKPVKRNSSASCKVDNVQMLLSALLLYMAAEKTITS